MAFTDKEFTYGDVTFRVDKLLPQEAKAVFMATCGRCWKAHCPSNRAAATVWR